MSNRRSACRLDSSVTHVWFATALNNDPEATKVREWRHKLQKAFLNSKAVPKEEVRPHICPFDMNPRLTPSSGNACTRPVILYCRELPQHDDGIPPGECRPL